MADKKNACMVCGQPVATHLDDDPVDGFCFSLNLDTAHRGSRLFWLHYVCQIRLALALMGFEDSTLDWGELETIAGRPN